MAPRSTWKGFLKISLVSVPVKAYTASASGSREIRLNQLHKDCNSRIRYQKTCPVHGEVQNQDIVSGYEYSKDQYVVIDTDELDKLRTEDEKAIKVDAFVAPDAIDPVFYSGRTYYLLPEGPVGAHTFGVIYQALVEQKRYAVAQVVLHGREQLVLLRPYQNLIAMSVLNYENQVTKPAVFEEEAPKEVHAAGEELKLAKDLISTASPKKFDLAKYKDVYIDKLTQLIEAKVAGQEIVAPPVQEQGQIINLMDALKSSLAKAKGEPETKPPKKMAASRAKAAAPPARKRKSS
jgi:DNA end-binding protein Ku